MSIRHIASSSTDPFINLALEEFLVRQETDAEYLVTYVNDESIVVGKHQNPFAEVDLAYLDQECIPVVRRLSGGGTVWHDKGNLNFALVSEHRPERHNRYAWFLRPVIDMLSQVGIEAQLSHRNSLVVKGQKVSGTAQFASRGRMISHGTLLIDSDLDRLHRALFDGHEDYQGIAVPSVRSAVVNLSSLSDDLSSVATVRTLLAEAYCGAGHAPELIPESTWATIRDLAASKYRTWEWTYGRTPRFTTQLRGAGESSGNVVVTVRAGIVQEVAPAKSEEGKDAGARMDLIGRRFDEILLMQ